MPNLRPNTTYYYRVKAITTNSESEYSDTIAVTTLSDNTSYITPISASSPNIAFTTVTNNTLDIAFNFFPVNEQIEEIKVTISPNADYSSPIYNNLTYVIGKNTATVVKDNETFITLQVQNLDPNTTYYGRVRVSNSISISNYTTFSFTTLTNLKAPIAIGITNLTAITARANWTLVPNATSYVLDVASNSNFSTLVINALDVGNVDHYNIPVLIENTTYYYRVRAKQGSTLSKNSNVISFTTLDDVNTYNDLTIGLAAPTIREVRNTKDTEFEVIWNPVNHATSYRVDISTVSNFSSFVVENAITTNTRYFATGLTPNTLYYFRVRAIHPSNTSPYTVRPVTTLAVNNTLNPPQALVPTTVFSNGFLFTWVKRTYATRYYIEISTASNFASITRSTYVRDVDSFLFDGLASNTVYYIRVYGLNNTQISPASNSVSITTEAPLPAIPLNPITELGSVTARLNWGLNAAYSKYYVTIYKQNDSSNYLGDGFYNLRDVGYTSSCYLDIFLEPSTTYSYIITGETPDGDRNQSNVGTFTTLATAPIISFSADGKYLEWSGVLNRLEVSTDKHFKFLKQGWNPRTIVSTHNRYDISNLMNEEINYYFRGYNNVGGLDGVRSNIISAYDKNPILLAPVVTDTTAIIRWKKTSSKLYRIQVKQEVGGNYVPITGHTFPVAVGDTDIYYLSGLTPNNNYNVTIQQYIESTNKYSDMSLPAYFSTQKHKDYADFLADTTENSALATITVSAGSTSFDRITLTIGGTVYSSYVIAVSRRPDFLTTEGYFETITNSVVFLGEPDITYYVRAHGISGTTRTTVATTTVTLSSLPPLPSDLTGTPTISNITILNENQAIITWSAISGAIGYEIEISKVNTFNYLDKSVVIEFLNPTQALISNLSGTSVYYVRVYGFNSHSISNISSTSTIDTTP